MNRIFFVLIAFFIVSVKTSAQDMYRVKADKLNVRETNSPKSKVVGSITQNENVAVLDSSDTKYYKVKLTNGEGWVSKDFLIRVSPPSKPAVTTKPVIASVPATIQDNSSLIVFSIIALILIVILIFIYKYAKQNKFLIGFSTLIILVTGYFCYITFIKEKTVSGTFSSNEDIQYKTFNFKSKDSVLVEDAYTDSAFTSKYVIDGDMIKLYDQQNTIMLLIRNENTLVGEGFTRGTFVKK